MGNYESCGSYEASGGLNYDCYDLLMNKRLRILGRFDVSR